MCLAAPVKKVEPKVEVKAPKKRVKKDENAPKKAMPPFFCYQGARRAGLKAEKPEAANPELIKILAQEWKALTDEQKKPFIEQGERNKL